MKRTHAHVYTSHSPTERAHHSDAPSPPAPPRKPRTAEPAQPPPPALTDEQAQVLRAVFDARTQRPIFITGKAGTGKSVLVRAIVQHAVASKQRHVLGVTASTGVAAVGIGGSTFASFFGFGQEVALPDAQWLAGGLKARLSPEVHATLLKTANWAQTTAARIRAGQRAGERRARDRFMNLQTVIIDEVSMLSAQALDNFDAVARILRGSPLPFGGLRVVLVGDFFQLAPVPQKVNGRELKDCNYQYAFQSRVWTGAGVRNFVLTQVHRQTDPVWLRMLEEIRVGRLTDATIDAFVARTRLQPPRAEDSAPVTHLYATNAPVQSENARALASLPGMPEVFRARDELLLGGDDVGRFLNDLAPAVVELKVGAHVMLLRNLRAEDLQAVGCVVLAQEGDSDIVLANGATGRVVAFERAPEDAARLGSPRWPVVAFPRTGRPTLRVRVESVASEFRDVPGQDPVKARRWQVPLQLCYASSAHKAQGKTILVPIVVKMQDIFAHGQAYVMFSRVPAFDQVFPVDFNPAKVTADPLVVAFSNSLGGTQ